MFLKKGDIVDIIAPSSPPKDKQWKKGLQIIQDWGLKARFPSRALTPWLFHAHNNKQRLTFLTQAFFNKDSSAVWMLRGGYGMQKLLPDFIKTYSKKKTRRKLFIGYSDGTALHLLLNQRKQASLQAPVISELAFMSQSQLKFLKDVLFAKKKEVVFKNLSVFQSSKLKKLRAPIIGGNLSLLSSSLGVNGVKNFKSHFLFIEDIDEEAHKIDRMLHHLFYSGALKGVKALLFGYFPPLKLKDIKMVLKSFSEVCNIPFIFDLPCGHKLSQKPLPFQTPAELSFKGQKASLKVSCR